MTLIMMAGLPWHHDAAVTPRDLNVTVVRTSTSKTSGPPSPGSETVILMMQIPVAQPKRPGLGVTASKLRPQACLEPGGPTR